MPVDVESYSLNQIHVLCNQQSELVAKFVFTQSLHFNTCAQMGALLPDCQINYTLIKLVPCCHGCVCVEYKLSQKFVRSTYICLT